jgi:TRAP transporter TAXI family solute receptor
MIFGAWLMATAPGVAQEPRPFIVAGGPVGGSYYRLAGQVCEAVMHAPTVEGLRCLVHPTAGSAENLTLLAAGAADFAILQSDWLYRAQSVLPAESEELSPPMSVVGLEGRAITLLTNSGSGIASLEDLKEKRLSFGPEGSPLVFGGEILLAALGWEREDLKEIVPLELEAMPAALCDGQVDGVVLPLVHPDPMVESGLRACDLRFVEVRGQDVETALQAWPFLTSLTIAEGLYPDPTGSIESFGLRAMLATGAGQDPSLVAAVTQAVVAGAEEDWILAPGAVAPVHPAAMDTLTASGLAPAPEEPSE